MLRIAVSFAAPTNRGLSEAARICGFLLIIFGRERIQEARNRIKKGLGYSKPFLINK